MTTLSEWARRFMEADWQQLEPCAPEFSLADLDPLHKARLARLMVLLVVAHPDDESECAAFLYRVTHELGGVVDQVVVTNGEAGTQYAAPAQTYYGVALTQRDLPAVRRGEVLRAGRILGVRHIYFLGQRDTGFSFDIHDGFDAWDTCRVRREIGSLLRREQYDLVVTLLPAPDTHGHHQAVTLLTLEAAAELPVRNRPAVLGVRTAGVHAAPEEFRGLPGYPLTRTAGARPAWSFDRRERLCGHPALDYSIVVNWIIAEHKSQGMFQMEYGRRTLENFWLFQLSGESGMASWRNFLNASRAGTGFPTETFQIPTNKDTNQCVSY